MKSRDIAFLAMYVALFSILSFVPYTGFIKVNVISITTIPVFLSLASYHLKFKGSMISSISFGFFSYIASITINPSILADPVILIVPRIILGFTLYLILKSLGSINLWKFIFLSLMSVICNTILLSSFVFIVSTYKDIYRESLRAWVLLIYINFLIEIAITITLSIALYPLIIYLIKNEENIKKQIW